MTSRPTRFQSELQAIADIAAALAHQCAAHEATEASLAAPTLRAAGDNTGRSSDVPDPVYAIVASLTIHDETRAQASEALGIMRAIQRRFSQVRQHHPEAAREAEAMLKALRCDGSWDPTCTRNAVRGGQCWACIKAKQRSEAEEQAS